MAKARYIYWEEDGGFLGYWEDYPDYWTQGDDRNDLEVHLLDIRSDLDSGAIPNVRRAAEVEIG